MPQKFFITHSWKDIEFATKLSNDLCANGLEGFLDAHSMNPGDSIPSRIERGLKDCDVYIPVFSPDSLMSDWCEWEIDLAITMNRTRKGRPHIIPVIARPCNAPDRLINLLYINFVGRYDQALNDLLTRGFNLSSKPAQSVVPPMPMTLPERQSFPKSPTPNAAPASPPAVSARAQTLPKWLVPVGVIVVMVVMICALASFIASSLVNNPTPTRVALASDTPVSTVRPTSTTFATLVPPTNVVPPATFAPMPTDTPRPTATVTPAPTDTSGQQTIAAMYAQQTQAAISAQQTQAVAINATQTALARPTTTSLPPATATYASLIAKRYPTLCLGVQSNSQSDGAFIEQRTCTGNASQSWEFQSKGGGYYQLIARSSGKCMTIQDGSQAEWAQIIQATCIGADYQLWYLKPFGNYVQLIAKHSGQCVDEDAFSSRQGLEMHQSPCRNSDNDNQLWQSR